mmetsp:Transcript_19864/g.19975  ORF Transcript_19864/g.19975 Transcript_19864/m.19975 type:complete len:522 (+) Transcript_19864:340-1905(+)
MKLNNQNFNEQKVKWIPKKKESDTLISNNFRKEQELFHLILEAKTYEEKLSECYQSDRYTIKMTRKHTDHLNELGEKIVIEQTTKRMLQLMYSRLVEETELIRAENDDFLYQRDSALHEYNIMSENVCRGRQELYTEEKALEDLLTTRKKRTMDRNKKVQELKQLVSTTNDEVALMQIQNSVIEQSQIMSPSVDIENISPIRPLTSKGSQYRSFRKHSRIDSMRSLSKNESEKEALTMKNNTISKINAEKETVITEERLHHIRDELVERLNTQKAKRSKLIELYESSSTRSRMLLQSNRQSHLEDEMNQDAIANANRELEEAQDKENQLNGNIDMLRKCLARFLKKLTKKEHKVPTREELLSSIQKLNETVLNEIKDISGLFISESTLAESDANKAKLEGGAKTRAGGEQVNESDWVQKLPGFDDIRKQLFNNIMTARPDVSGNNVRVEIVRNDSDDRMNVFANMVIKDDMSEDSAYAMEDDPDADDFLDRAMIKHVSILRIEKNIKRKKKNRSRRFTSVL